MSSLYHLPSVLISHMGNSVTAAVVTAPILKLCDAELDGHFFACMSKCRMVPLMLIESVVKKS